MTGQNCPLFLLLLGSPSTLPAKHLPDACGEQDGMPAVFYGLLSGFPGTLPAKYLLVACGLQDGMPAVFFMGILDLVVHCMENPWLGQVNLEQPSSIFEPGGSILEYPPRNLTCRRVKGRRATKEAPGSILSNPPMVLMRKVCF